MKKIVALLIALAMLGIFVVIGTVRFTIKWVPVMWEDRGIDAFTLAIAMIIFTILALRPLVMVAIEIIKAAKEK